MHSTQESAISEKGFRELMSFMHASEPPMHSAQRLHTVRLSNMPTTPKDSSALGIESPTTIRYEVATPKHLMATKQSMTVPTLVKPSFLPAKEATS